MTWRILPVVLFLISCRSGSASDQEVARPPQAGTGEAVAHVFLVDGTARVTASNGFGFDAAPGAPLCRTDEVEAPVGGFVILRLKNNYLARIDEEVSLRIMDLVLLDAPSMPEDFASQLDSMLSNKERERGERIAGWHARLTGAQTIPPQTASREMQPEARRIRKKGVGAEEAVPRRTEKKSRASKLEAPHASRDAFGAAPAPAAGAGTAASSGAKADQLAQGKADEMPVTWYVQVGRKRTVQKAALPVLVREMIADTGMRQCLQTELDKLPTRPQKLNLLIRLEKNRVTRLVLGGGLRTPACARKKYAGRHMPEGPSSGWVVLEVELP